MMDYNDKRLTLVGNAWAVPVVSWLIGQLVGPRGAGLASYLEGQPVHSISADEAPTSARSEA